MIFPSNLHHFEFSTFRSFFCDLTFSVSGVILKFSFGDENRRQTLPAVHSLEEVKEIATHLFDDTLPEGFGVSFVPDDAPPFLLTNSRAFAEANAIAQPKTCVINRQTYYTLRFAIHALDDPSIPAPRDDLLLSPSDSLSDEIVGDSERVLEGESFHVDHDVVDDVDDIYDHDGFMADDLPPSESDNGEEELSNLSSQLLDKSASTTTVSTNSGYGAAAMGAVYTVIKTAFLAPTYFCTGCGTSSPAAAGEKAEGAK